MSPSQSRFSGMSGERPDAVIESLAHGLEVLGLFTEQMPVLGVGEIARSMGVHRSTASRLAATLSFYNFLSPAGEQGRYRLGPRLIRLGELAAADLDLRRTAREAMKQLAEALGETVHLGLADGTEVVTAVVVDGWHTVRMHSAPGKRSPAHCSSIGKALLAGLSERQLDELFRGHVLERRTTATIQSIETLKLELKRSRERGYTLDDEELEAGLRCVGAPLFDHAGKVVAAISASGPTSRLHGQCLDVAIETVRSAASSISVRLGCATQASFWGPSPASPSSVPPPP
jgi:DNA-binding IclR family transcriptional regulator